MYSTLSLIHADNWYLRARGLLFREQLKTNEVLWLQPCQAVHTVGMRYPIAVYFLDRCHHVVRVIPELKPFRSAWSLEAVSVVETRVSDTLTADDIQSAIQLFLNSR